MEYVFSNKNKKLKIYDGYSSIVEKTIENTMYLRCTEHHCKSRMIVKSESITKRPSNHLHVADVNKLHARIVVANTKNEATHIQLLPQQIICTTKIPTRVVVVII
jgi:DNA-directed RNA polymerase subunit RPC12/RpoP